MKERASEKRPEIVPQTTSENMPITNSFDNFLEENTTLLLSLQDNDQNLEENKKNSEHVIDLDQLIIQGAKLMLEASQIDPAEITLEALIDTQELIRKEFYTSEPHELAPLSLAVQNPGKKDEWLV